MYTIKQASSRTGIPVPTIRAWERRYRVVSPARTASGYRLYDDASLQRLDSMRRLVADGWQPSVAAAALLAGALPTGELSSGELRAETEATTAVAPTALGTAPSDDDDAPRFVAAARAMDGQAIAAFLDDLFAHGSFERVVSDRLFPALEALGDAWASGHVSVAGEHLASHAVLRRLSQALEAAGRSDTTAAPVVVGLPPGARHELGALAYAVALRRAGLPVAYLGPDLPIEDWLTAARGASAAVLGVVTARDRRSARVVVQRLREAAPGLVVAVGGRSAQGVSVPGVLELPDELEASVARLADAVRATASGG